jgi:PKD repeat protein
MKNPLLAGLSVLLGILLWMPAYSAPLSGTYTIDKSGSGSTNFTSFAAVASALLVNGTSGTVIFKIADGIYTEQVYFERGGYAGNPVRFESASGDSTKVILTWPSSTVSTKNYTLYLYKANYLEFRKLTIERSGSAAYSTTVQVDNSKGVIFQNNRLFGPRGLSISGTGGVIASDLDINADLLIDNNLIRGGQNGIYFANTKTTDLATGLQIRNNIIDSMSSIGVTIYKETEPIIDGNQILITKGGGFGIYVANCFAGNVSIQRNRIVSTSPNLDIGIGLFDVSSFPNAPAATVANNSITIAGSGSSMGIWTSIKSVSYTGGHIDIYHNSINMTADDNTSKGIEVGSDYGDAYNIADNNIATYTGYPIYIDDYSDAAAFMAFDHNNYYTEGAYIGRGRNANIETLEDWQNGGIDLNSLSVNPGFKSATDLHTRATALNNAGMYVGIDDDIDGEPRDTNTPDIGADEFNVAYPDAGIGSIESLATSYCSAVTKYIKVRLVNHEDDPLYKVKIAWAVNGNLKNVISWSGNLEGHSDTVLILDSFLFVQPSVNKLTAYSFMPNDVDDLTNTNDTASLTVTVYQPDATFDYGERSGKSIAFRSKDANIASSTWNFGDGNTSTDKDPTHIYASAGKYKVTHTITTSAGCMTVVEDTITVTGTAGLNDPGNGNSVQVYPNPFTSDIVISYSLNTSTLVNLQLFDVSGRVIKEWSQLTQLSGSHTLILDGTDLKAGVYLLKLNAGNSTAYSRILKK